MTPWLIIWMSNTVFGGRWYYFEAEIKDVHEWDVAWSIVKQHMNVGTSFSKQYFFKWWKNQPWKMACVTRTLGLLIYTAGREPVAVFLSKGSWVL